VSKRKPPNDSARLPSPPTGEGGERDQREPGEGAKPSPENSPSPALNAPHIGHPLPQGEREKKVCVARIGAAHGVRGAVKLWTFTEDPLAVKRYGPLSTQDGARHFEVTAAREAKSYLVATLKGVTTRQDAERLNGLELYVAREKLPAADENEYYHADLIGLAAVTANDEPLGRVVAIHNFGAGDIIEIAPPQGATMLLPFSTSVVPTVDLAGGRVVIELPGEIEGDDEGSL
jgi:16S rRNA processing protein RimM